MWIVHKGHHALYCTILTHCCQSPQILHHYRISRRHCSSRSTATPPFVLDDVLYNESDLDLEEHYTDTHGYTEINFAVSAMIGMDFCPCICGLHRQRIDCADLTRDHGVLEPVLRRARRAVNFRRV